MFGKNSYILALKMSENESSIQNMRSAIVLKNVPTI